MFFFHPISPVAMDQTNETSRLLNASWASDISITSSREEHDQTLNGILLSPIPKDVKNIELQKPEEEKEFVNSKWLPLRSQCMLILVNSIFTDCSIFYNKTQQRYGRRTIY